MFQVSVEETFSAGHALRGYRGKCENVHGHNYRVRVTLEGPQLDAIGLLVDFTRLKQLAPIVTNVRDFDDVLFDAIEYRVGVARYANFANTEIRPVHAEVGVVAEQVYGVLNGVADQGSSRWIALTDIALDRPEVGNGAPRITELYSARKRAKAAATSASLANSPRSTWASPSRMAAMAAASSGSTGRANASAISARAVSCSSGNAPSAKWI